MGVKGIGYEAQKWIELVQSRKLVGCDKNSSLILFRS
jgi:hypothetical protein